MKLPPKKLKKNKYLYVSKLLPWLKAQITDTNIFVFQRYCLYRDIVLPRYKIRLKKRNRKGLIQCYQYLK